MYTAIFGNKDVPKEFEKAEGIDYLIFTENPDLISKTFDVIVVPPLFKDPVRNSKIYKILQPRVFSNYQYSLWIDANISIARLDLNDLFGRYLEHHDIALHKHPERNCIYQEADACIQLEKDNPSIIKRQMKKYQSENYPVQNGLIESGIIFRRHSSTIAQINKKWWEEISRHSRRDQLSFNYVLSTLNKEFNPLNGCISHNSVPGFVLHRHKLSDFRNW